MRTTVMMGKQMVTHGDGDNDDGGTCYGRKK